jgi:hypothetical protein
MIVKKPFQALLYALAALIIVLLLTVPHAVIEAVQTSSAGHSLNKEYDWYILPKSDGTQPTPNEQATFIKDYKAWFVGSPYDKTIYLTFDAGYEKAIDVANERGVTMFAGRYRYSEGLGVAYKIGYEGLDHRHDHYDRYEVY